MSANNDNLLRKLGAAEIVYDYELPLKSVLLPFSMLFKSQVDLFAHKEKIERAIQIWKSIHPFLVCKIVARDDDKHPKFSNERYFAYASEQKIDNIDNVNYVKLVGKNNDYWRLLHERELNIEPVDSANGLLWRIMFVELNDNNYCLIFTVHHCIVDARNGFTILDQLLSLIDQLIDNSLDETKLEKFTLGPSIEEKLFNNDKSQLSNIKVNEKYDVSPDCKVPSSFSSNEQDQLSQINNDDRFVYQFSSDENNNQLLYVKDLLQANDYITRFTSFSFDEKMLKGLLSKCKQMNSKLTGCLNLICALATHDLYKNFKHAELSRTICFHLLANLRPFLNLGNLDMGYWPVVFNGIVELNSSFELNGEFFRTKFWKMAQTESDSLHERIRQKEHYENAKMDTILLDLINNNHVFENGGGVHFAISNLGPLKATKMNNFRITELYYNTSCAPNRWSAIVFHGLCSIDDTLCWSLGYNRSYVRREIIDYLLNSIKRITNLALEADLTNTSHL